VLTHEQRDYYDALDAVFSLPGWKKIIEDATAQIYQNQADALEAPDWDTVNVLRGKSLALSELTNLEETSIVQRRMLEEPDYADV